MVTQKSKKGNFIPLEREELVQHDERNFADLTKNGNFRKIHRGME
jgi:hypothetical protein